MMTTKRHLVTTKKHKRSAWRSRMTTEVLKEVYKHKVTKMMYKDTQNNHKETKQLQKV